METVLNLVPGVDSFTLPDLLRLVATHKGLRLYEGASRAYSEPIKEYQLDSRLLAILDERKIRRQDRPDCHNEIFTLVDENWQEKVPGYKPSSFWNFKRLEDKSGFDLRVTLSVDFCLNIEKRGIVFVPQARGSFVSAADSLPNFRMFKALTESDKDAPAIAKELAASDGNIVVLWTDIGLGGIRKLSHLFTEFACGNKAIEDLSWRKEDVFDPQPSSRFRKSEDELFIAESAQPKVFMAWRGQLDKYRGSLAVA